MTGIVGTFSEFKVSQLGKTLLPTPKHTQTPKLNNISPRRKTLRAAILNGFLFCFLLSCQFSEVS